MTASASSPGGDDKLDLSQVDSVVQAAMATSESALSAELGAIKPTENMNAEDMLQIQYDMANYTVAGQTLSGIMKDMSDTYKSVVEKLD